MVTVIVSVAHPVSNIGDQIIIRANFCVDVAFFRGTCDWTGLFSSGDSGCIDFTAGGTARSYMILDDAHNPGTGAPRADAGTVTRHLGDGTKAKGLRRAAAAWQLQQDAIRQELGLSVKTASGSLSPIWDPDITNRQGFGHGMIKEAFGEPRKWHQVALGISVGIPLDEWDDTIHIKSDRFVPYGDVDFEEQLREVRKVTRSRESQASNNLSASSCSACSPLEERALFEKRWNYAQCRAIMSCGRKIGAAAWMQMNDGWRQTVECAKRAQAAYKTLYDFVNQYPTTCGVVKLTAAGAVGFGFGMIKSSGGATAQDNDQLAHCGTSNDQANAFVEGMLEVANAGAHSAAQVDITLENGHILSLSGEVYEEGHAPPRPLCNAG
jgi:hypothetical protein